jgi:hypothetical protein
LSNIVAANADTLQPENQLSATIARALVPGKTAVTTGRPPIEGLRPGGYFVDAAYLPDDGFRGVSVRRLKLRIVRDVVARRTGTCCRRCAHCAGPGAESAGVGQLQWTSVALRPAMKTCAEVQTGTDFRLDPVAETTVSEVSIGPVESGWMRWTILAKAYNIAGGYREIIALLEGAPTFKVIPPSGAQ